MITYLELRYLRDGSQLALDATLHEVGREPRHQSRLYLAEAGNGHLDAVLTRFNSAFEEGLLAADRFGFSGRFSEVSRVLKETIKPAAEQLGALLLPETIHEWLDIRPSPRIQFVCDGDLMDVPFEAIWWRMDFLGFRYAVCRKMITRHLGDRPRLKVSTPPSCAIVADPGALLDQGGKSTAGSKVSEVLDDFLGRWRGQALRVPNDSRLLSSRIDADGINALVSSHDVVILLGHHESDRSDPKGSLHQLTGRGLEIGPGTFYSGTDLHGAIAPNGQVPFLICSPSCHSGVSLTWRQNWRADDGVCGIADAALRLGVPNFIGTLFQVHSESVAHMIEPLLVAMDEGYGMPEALRQARCGLRLGNLDDPFHPGTLAGLAFVLLGSPSSVLLSAGGVRLDHGSDVAWCGEVGAGGACGRAIAATDSGHSARRCRHHHQPVDEAPDPCSAGHPSIVSRLKTCGKPGCTATYCPQCRTSSFQRCWRHAGASALIDEPYEGVRCRDPYSWHPNEPRMVALEDEGGGYELALCPDCTRGIRDSRQPPSRR
jgi:hypothetical protein